MFKTRSLDTYIHAYVRTYMYCMAVFSNRETSHMYNAHTHTYPTTTTTTAAIPKPPPEHNYKNRNPPKARRCKSKPRPSTQPNQLITPVLHIKHHGVIAC